MGLSRDTAAGGVLRSGTAVTASGTSVNFTDIPSWVKRITVMFSGVSTSGTANLLIQVGAGSVTTTGYNSTSTGADSSVGTSTYTTGFGVRIGNASNVLSGQLVIATLGSNAWVSSGVIGSTLGLSLMTTGSINLSGTLDRVRITTTNGTDTFDAGTINILFE